ncbi:unnamed protein product [Allacma fusca]|uniref:Uncharacterized protein n=1 Tax=Allacma fusca TaxID=39272 RepID=A0A8J2K658_9HEXA|nr:unnamed protein product [Allacma fusca]
MGIVNWTDTKIFEFIQISNYCTSFSIVEPSSGADDEFLSFSLHFFFSPHICTHKNTQPVRRSHRKEDPFVRQPQTRQDDSG